MPVLGPNILLSRVNVLEPHSRVRRNYNSAEISSESNLLLTYFVLHKQGENGHNLQNLSLRKKFIQFC